MVLWQQSLIGLIYNGIRYFHAPVIAYCNKGRCKKNLFDGKIALWCERMGMNTVFQILNVVSPELSCYKEEISPQSGALFSVKYTFGEPNVAFNFLPLEAG